MPKNTENPRFCEFQIAINWPKLIKIGRITHQKFWQASYFYRKKNFVLKQKIEGNIPKTLPPQKGPFFLGGGGKIIKWRLRRLSLNMKKQKLLFFSTRPKET